MRDVGTAQSKTNPHTALSVPVGGSGIPAGRTVVVAVASDPNATNVTCADSKGNTYTQDVDQTPGGDTARVTVLSAYVTVPLLAADAITVTHGSITASAMSVTEFSGILDPGRLDRVASNTGTASPLSSGSTAATTQAEELVIGAFAVEGPLGDTFTPDPPYAALGRNGTTGNPATGNMTINAMYNVVYTTGTQSAGGSNSNRDWAGAIATYKAAASVCPGGVVTTTADYGPSSLRECLTYANVNPGTTVSFNIPGPRNQAFGGDSWWRIAPASPLPPIAAANTVVDGATQTTNQGNFNTKGPEIELNGASAGAGVTGLRVTGATSTLRGLVVNQWGGRWPKSC